MQNQLFWTEQQAQRGQDPQAQGRPLASAEPVKVATVSWAGWAFSRWMKYFIDDPCVCSQQLLPVVLVGPPKHAVSALCFLLDLLEKVRWAEDADQTGGREAWAQPQQHGTWINTRVHGGTLENDSDSERALHKCLVVFMNVDRTSLRTSVKPLMLMSECGSSDLHSLFNDRVG